MKLATSKAGHDKGVTYVVIKEEVDAYYLADGKGKNLSKLKRKNKKHLQIIKNIPEDAELQELAAKLDAGDLKEDHEVKRILTIYKKCRRDEDV